MIQLTPLFRRQNCLHEPCVYGVAGVIVADAAQVTVFIIHSIPRQSFGPSTSSVLDSLQWSNTKTTIVGDCFAIVSVGDRSTCFQESDHVIAWIHDLQKVVVGVHCGGQAIPLPLDKLPGPIKEALILKCIEVSTANACICIAISSGAKGGSGHIHLDPECCGIHGSSRPSREHNDTRPKHTCRS